jgi:two-component system phosphate regulon sensor histidine kinase PhoR
MRVDLHYKITFLIVSIVFFILAGIYLHLVSLPGGTLQASHDLRRDFLIAWFIAIIPAGLLSFSAATFISRPIRRITRSAAAISGRDFPERLDIRSDDEIGDLARALNDMSEQVQARLNEILAEKSRLEAVFLSMIEGVMILDRQGTIILMNRALKDFLKVERDPVGRKPLEIIRNIEIQEMADSVFLQPGGSRARELKVLIPEERVLLVRATPVTREGQGEGAVMIFHDITGLRQLEKVRQDFVANVSHELRTPVSTIKGYAETLLHGALEDKENAENFLRIIYEDSDRLAKLINDLLDLSRIESGKLELRPCSIPIRPVVDRVLAVLKNRIMKKNIDVRASFEPGLSPARADENSFSQILLNLLENAVKYNKENGRIMIEAREDPGSVIIAIQDTGIGIPEKDLSRIFERFYRVDKAHSREIGGTGLGLSIVKHLVQANGGTIRVESAVGAGTSFYVSLPKQ